MHTVLVTSASRGIGLEFARQYGAYRWRVFACCRKPDQTFDLSKIIGHSNDRVTVHQLDLDDALSVADLKNGLARQPLDVLVNNAGITGQSNAALGNIDYMAWQNCLTTNVLEPTRMAEAFADNVSASRQKN